MVIYKMTNEVSNKVYIGQTNNFEQRMRAHKSDASNPNSHNYYSHLSCAIRKYGWNNFNNVIIEEIEDEDREKANEREIYYIEFYDSANREKGYNITFGGGGVSKPEPFYEEKLTMSHLFTSEEIKDIQEMLRAGRKYQEIMKKYPQMSGSFLANINTGLNFKNPDWDYPLHEYKKDFSKYRPLEEINQIKEEIKKGKDYKIIAQNFNISVGMVSMINNGKTWRDENETYPLVTKGSSRVHNLNSWVPLVKNDIINSNLTLKQIAEKYNKAESTIKKINQGYSYREPNTKYPLLKNRKKSK